MTGLHSPENSDHLPDPVIPTGLGAELQRIAVTGPGMALDRAILDAAQPVLLARRWRRRLVIAAPLAAAAGLALALVLIPTGGGARGGGGGGHGGLAQRAPSAPAGGKPDMLDVLALARALERQTPVDPSWDFSGDGQVDGMDVDAAAMVAVSLAPAKGRAS